MQKPRLIVDEATLTDEALKNMRLRKEWVERRMLELYKDEETLKRMGKAVPRPLKTEGRRLAAETRRLDELLMRHAMIAVDAAAAAEVAAGANAGT